MTRSTTSSRKRAHDDVPWWCCQRQIKLLVITIRIVGGFCFIGCKVFAFVSTVQQQQQHNLNPSRYRYEYEYKYHHQRPCSYPYPRPRSEERSASRFGCGVSSSGTSSSLSSVADVVAVQEESSQELQQQLPGRESSSSPPPSSYSANVVDPIESATFSSRALMDPIVEHPSVAVLDLQRRPRRKLKPRHKALFRATNDTNTNTTSLSLFETLATVCCESGVVPRKEFFETYAAACYIHNEAFPVGTHRVADLAAGHGLLSWMLLAMDRYGGGSTDGSGTATRTAICVDRRMPPSAVAIAKSMRKHLFPINDKEGDGSNNTNNINDNDDASLYDRVWTYVECDLKNVAVTDASTLLVSVHACGTLTDYLIDMGIGGSSGDANGKNIGNNNNNTIVSAAAPMAIVPCCHTYSIRKGYTPHPEFSGTTAERVGWVIETEYEQELEREAQRQRQLQLEKEQQQIEQASEQQQRVPKTKAKPINNPKFKIVENVIDQVRLRTLTNAGYNQVKIASLPLQFTERNRLVLASCRNDDVHDNDNDDANSGNGIDNNTDIDNGLLEAAEETTTTATVASPKQFIVRKGSMPPIVAKKKDKGSDKSTTTGDNTINIDFDDSFVVPLRDNPQSIRDCLAVSGKARALQRMRKLLPNHFAPKLDVSMWLSPTSTTGKGHGDDAVVAGAAGDVDANATLEALQGVLDETVHLYCWQQRNDNNNNTTTRNGGADKNSNDDRHAYYYSCCIRPLNEIFIHPKTGRIGCIYQIEYSYSLGESKNNDSTIADSANFCAAPFPKNKAKELHKLFCDNVVRSINGTEIR